MKQLTKPLPNKNARPNDEERGHTAAPNRALLARSSSSVSFPLDVMKPRALYVIIGFLLVVLLGGAALIAWGYWQVYGIGGWRDQLYASEGAVASRQALDDFRAGHLRLYTLGGESEKAKFTGTNDGPFEIWIPHFYPSLGVAHRYSTEQFIEFYNRKMKYMHEHPDEFLLKRQEVQRDGAANRSQPVSSETNRTSVAAGSGR